MQEPINNTDEISLKELMVHLPGSLKRKCRIAVGSIVMVSYRGFENKGDICYLYSSDDKEFLLSKGYVFEKNDINNGDDDDDEEYGDDDDSDYEDDDYGYESEHEGYDDEDDD